MPQWFTPPIEKTVKNVVHVTRAIMYVLQVLGSVYEYIVSITTLENSNK